RAHIGNDSPHRDSCSSSSDIDSPSENDYSFCGTLLQWAQTLQSASAAPCPPCPPCEPLLPRYSLDNANLEGLVRAEFENLCNDGFADAQSTPIETDGLRRYCSRPTQLQAKGADNWR